MKKLVKKETLIDIIIAVLILVYLIACYPIANSYKLYYANEVLADYIDIVFPIILFAMLFSVVKAIFDEHKGKSSVGFIIMQISLLAISIGVVANCIALHRRLDILNLDHYDEYFQQYKSFFGIHIYLVISLGLGFCASCVTLVLRLIQPEQRKRMIEKRKDGLAQKQARVQKQLEKMDDNSQQ